MPNLHDPCPDQDGVFFGAPPLVKGEDPTKYQELLETISMTVEPADIFERAFVRTIVNLIWEANRYRRLIADILAAAEQQALERLLRHLLYGKKPHVYRVLYEVEEQKQTVWVLTIRHGARQKIQTADVG